MDLIIGQIIFFAFITLLVKFLLAKMGVISRIRLNVDDRDIPLLIRITYPSFTYLSTYLKPFVERYKCEGLKKLITYSNLDEVLTPVSFISLEIISCIFAGALSIIYAGKVGLGAILFIGLGGLLPILILKNEASKRSKQIDRDLPGLLDLLALSVEAGQDYIVAIFKISKKLKKGPLKGEVIRLESLISKGMRRAEALHELSTRTGSTSFRSFMSVLIQAERLGTGVADTLRAFASSSRSRRFALAEREGIKASQKMLFPIVLCIMPVTFIIIFGPIVMGFVMNGFMGFMNI